MFVIMARQNQRMGSGVSRFWLASSPAPRAGGQGPEKCWSPVKK